MKLPFILPNKLYSFIYLSVMLLAGVLFTPSHFSTNMLSIFPQNSYTKVLEDASQLESMNRLIIISRGDDKASKMRLDAISKKLEAVEGIDKVNFKTDDLHSPTAQYLRKHYAERLEINASRATTAFIEQKMAALYTEMVSSFMFSALNTSDPLGLFSDPMQKLKVTTKEGIVLFKDKDFMLNATLHIKVSDVAGSQRLYEAVHAIVDGYGSDVIAFAPHFFTAENSAKIKREVNLIIVVTMVLLLLFYAFSLRDFKVLVLTSLALGSSLFVGLSAVTYVFEDVSVFTLAFGSGIAMMAVDYFFHYYFHGYYSAKTKERKKVFYAFLTTVSGFGILLFADFPLIEQLALFGIVALAFSYFQFSFLFAAWRFEPKLNRLRLRAISKGFVNAKVILLLSLLLLGFGFSQLHFNGDLRQLDYQNKPLLALQKEIRSSTSAEKPVLVFADTLDTLLVKLESLQQEIPAFRSFAQVTRSKEGFEKYRSEIKKLNIAKVKEEITAAAEKAGFRKGSFKDAYAFLQGLHYSPPNLQIAKSLGYETKQLGERKWITLAFVGEEEARLLAGKNDVVVLEAATLLKKGVEGVLDQLLFIALLTFVLISILLIVLLKRRALVAMNYVLFPLGVITTVLALLGTFSVMHLFALIIVMVAAIDYGIYMSSAEEETDEAIYYAMLTTFAGFGIFVFSHIGALHHIGLVIALGIVSTFMLQTVQKR